MVMSHQCEQYQNYILRNRVNKDPFPATAKDLLSYIRYRGRNSTCFNYFANLDLHPLHGKEWLKKMNNDEKIKNEIRLLIRLWDVPVFKYASSIGVSDSLPGKSVPEKTPTRSPFQEFGSSKSGPVMRGFMVSQRPSINAPNNTVTPVGVPVSKTMSKSKSTSVTKSLSNKLQSKASGKTPSKAFGNTPSNTPSKTTSNTPSKTTTKTPSKTTSKTKSNVRTLDGVSKSIRVSSSNSVPRSKSDRISGSSSISKPSSIKGISKQKKDKLQPKVLKSSPKRKLATSLLNEKIKKREVITEYSEPYVLIESLDPARQVRDNNNYQEVDDLEIGYNRLNLYESEEEGAEEEKHEEGGEYDKDDFDIEAFNNYIEEKEREEKLEKETGIRVNEGTLYIVSHVAIEKSFS